MTKEEAVAVIVEMYGKFAHDCLCSGNRPDPKYATAVAVVSLALTEVEDGN